MIREGKKLPVDVLENLPKITELIAVDDSVVAFYSFGSLARREELKPLSDLDFAVLLSNELNRSQRFHKRIEIVILFNKIFRTDEIDLITLNDAPLRFSYNIIRDGKLLFCRDKRVLIDFYERVVKIFLDFKFFRNEFEDNFLNKVGYHG